MQRDAAGSTIQERLQEKAPASAGSNWCSMQGKCGRKLMYLRGRKEQRRDEQRKGKAELESTVRRQDSTRFDNVLSLQHPCWCKSVYSQAKRFTLHYFTLPLQTRHALSRGEDSPFLPFLLCSRSRIITHQLAPSAAKMPGRGARFWFGLVWPLIKDFYHYRLSSVSSGIRKCAQTRSYF